MKNIVLQIIGSLGLFILVSCGENAPVGPDLTNISLRDHAYFNEIYDRCSINNTTTDCNCVARVNVEHRDSAYDAYAADYDTVHKPELEEEIKKRKKVDEFVAAGVKIIN